MGTATKPSWFVIAEQDRAIDPEQERSTAHRTGAKTMTLPTSHLPMLSQPDKVAEFVIAAAASLSDGPRTREIDSDEDPTRGRRRVLLELKAWTAT